MSQVSRTAQFIEHLSSGLRGVHQVQTCIKATTRAVTDAVRARNPDRVMRALVGLMPQGMQRLFGEIAYMHLLRDPRVRALHRYMMDEMPVRYEPLQAEYYLRHYARVLAPGSPSRDHTPVIDLEDPHIRYFTRIERSALDRWLIDSARLEGDARLCAEARGLKVAVLEMNGGVGSSMGFDPARHLSKADGIVFRPRGPRGEDVLGAEVSVMMAKLLHLLHLKDAFREVHVIPWNSTITEQGWRAFLAHPSACAPQMTNQEYLVARGLALHQSVVQQAFPLLSPDARAPVKGDVFERTVAPGGHGQILYHLYFSGILRTLADQGIGVLVIANSDSVNAAPRPALAAALIRDHTMAGLVSTDRSPLDAKGGIFAIFGTELGIIERASVDERQRKDFEMIGLAAGENPQPFNTNTVYLNLRMVLAYLEQMEHDHGSEAVHEALMPHTIGNRKSVTLPVDGVMREEQGCLHLEGALATVVLKFPGVKLYNVRAEDRSTHFTPLKGTSDVVYYFDSDAFYYDAEEHRLVQQRSCATQAEITLEGWAGWKNLAATRAAFGHPSLAHLTHLYVKGPVRAVDAAFEGNVAIVNETGVPLDCATLPELRDAQRRVRMRDAIVHASGSGTPRVMPFTPQNGAQFKLMPR